jgi:hypothetical protein
LRECLKKKKYRSITIQMFGQKDLGVDCIFTQ